MLSHLLDTLTEILSQFTLGNTTTATVFILQRENLEIVQLTKDAELAKLEMPVMNTKRMFPSCCFNGLKKSLIMLRMVFCKSSSLTESCIGGIIFVDENDCLLTCLSGSSKQNIPKASPKAFTSQILETLDSIFLLFQL